METVNSSSWKKSINAATGGASFLISNKSNNMINGIDMIPPRIMKILFQGNPQITIITCFSPTNVSEGTEVDTFYTQLTDTIREIPNHNVLIIGGDLNAQLGQDNSLHIIKQQIEMVKCKMIS